MNAYEWVGRMVVLVWVGLLLGAGVAWLRSRIASRLQTSATPARPGDQRDLGDETDPVPEGLGVVPPPCLDFRRPSPHVLEPRRTTPLAYLEEWEWQLWTSVIQESAR